MDFSEFNLEERLRKLWFSTRIARDVHYSLFTFGDSDLPYYLVEDARTAGELVKLHEGKVAVSRPRIITPYASDRPEFEGFFDDGEQERMFSVLLSRTAAFSRLSFSNTHGPTQAQSDSVEEVVGRLNHRLDSEEEDRVAILTAPHGLGGIAVFRYTVERVLRSAPENIQELRERGLLE
jgi:hypothetical protein